MWLLLSALFFSGLTHADTQTWVWSLREARLMDLRGHRAERLVTQAQAELVSHPSAELKDAYLEFKRSAFARGRILTLDSENAFREPLLRGLHADNTFDRPKDGSEHPFFVINKVRLRSLTNFWPGIDDVTRYQAESSPRERELWQGRKDLVSRATLIALKQTLENLLILQSSVLGVRGEPLRNWANQWMKGACPLCFHRDRDLLWQWASPAADTPAVSQTAWIKHVCRVLNQNAYPHQSRPMPQSVGTHLWGPSYSLSDQKAENEWIKARVRAIYLSSLDAPMGALIMTKAISHYGQGAEPMSVNFDCEHPEKTPRNLLQQAAREAMSEATRLWTEYHRDNDPWNLSTESISHSMQDLLIRNPEAVGHALLTTASNTDWVVSIAKKIQRDQKRQENLDRAIFFGATAASLLIPAGGELLAATLLEQAIIRAGLLGISCLKMAHEWNRSQESMENSRLFMRAFFANGGDHYSLVGSSQEILKSRELALDFVLDLGFSFYQVFKLYRDVSRVVVSTSGRVPASALNARLRMESEKLLKAKRRLISSSSRQVLKKTLENAGSPERAY